jgi:hypothetical protein
LDIDADVLSAARDLAKAEGRRLGAVISEMARRGFTQPVSGAAADPAPQDDLDAWLASKGFGPLPGATAMVTNEQVEAIRDELGI